MQKPPTVSQQTTPRPAFLSLPQLPPAAPGSVASFRAVIHVSFYWSCQRPLDTGSFRGKYLSSQLNSKKMKKKKKLLRNVQPPGPAAVAEIAFPPKQRAFLAHQKEKPRCEELSFLHSRAPLCPGSSPRGRVVGGLLRKAAG